jgi:hypothetical protein
VTAGNLLQEIEADGVRLVVTSHGTIKVAGESDALDKWTPVIQRRKPELIELLYTWAELETAIHERCDTRGDSEENRQALLSDCRELATTDWPWFAWYFRQEASKWTH